MVSDVTQAMAEDELAQIEQKEEQTDEQRKAELRRLLLRYPVTFYVDDQSYLLSSHFYSNPQWILRGADLEPYHHRLHLVETDSYPGQTWEPGSLDLIFVLDFMRFTTENVLEDHGDAVQASDQEHQSGNPEGRGNHRGINAPTRRSKKRRSRR